MPFTLSTIVTPAEVCVLHGLVAAHLVAEALHDGGAAHHDHDPVGNGEDELHIMLAEKYGEAELFRELLYEVDAAGGLFRRHACGRLVEDQELGFAAQGYGDLQHLSLAMGEGRACPVLSCREAHALDDLALSPRWRSCFAG